MFFAKKNNLIRLLFKVNNKIGVSRNEFSSKIMLFSTSALVFKKHGKFSQIENQTNVVKKVKLYPGFQTSVEEMRQQSLVQNADSEQIYAKKIIEDFYGLNELEYEDNEEQEEIIANSETDNEKNKFDLDTAVALLKEENVRDICCIQIPSEINYAEFMLIGSCFSDKHLNSAFLRINRRYKSMKEKSARFMRRRSGEEKEWCAIDTGKIVMHLFVGEARTKYDLESLWACGSECDEKALAFSREQAEIEKRLVVDETKNS